MNTKRIIINTGVIIKFVSQVTYTNTDLNEVTKVIQGLKDKLNKEIEENNLSYKIQRKTSRKNKTEVRLSGLEDKVKDLDQTGKE